MNFNLMSDNQIVDFTQQQSVAIDQQLAQIFPDHMNPYAAPGGFVQGQLDFNQAFLNQSWQQSVALAEILPNDQPMPVFNTAGLVGANMGAQIAGDNLLGAVQYGSNVMGDAWGHISGAISGNWSGTTMDGTVVSGISSDFSHAGVDQFGNVIGSNMPIQDPWFSPVVAWSTPSFF